MTTKTTASFLYGSVISAGLALLPFSTAVAETETGTLEVTAKVVATCSVSGTTLSFGFYNPELGDLPGSASFVVLCSTETPVTISLDGGKSETGGTRNMKDENNNLLEYALFQDVTRLIEFGGDAGPGESKGDTGMPNPGTTVDVFGLIPGDQTVPTGDYDDSVQISIEF